MEAEELIAPEKIKKRRFVVKAAESVLYHRMHRYDTE